MNSNSHALIAATAPLISLAAALPQHYASRPINTEIAVPSNEQHEVNVKLASLDQKGNATVLETKPEADQNGQCVNHGNFTYYSERPLPGAESESILIEECDPSNPNQIRLAYVANKSIKGKLSPTSILIGCTSTSPKAFAGRQDGAFTRVAPGVYTNFVRRALAQPTGMSTLAKKPAIKMAGHKRSEQQEGEQPLVKRWESRSDIDQYSDGYHTCHSASSSACRLFMTEKVCPDLEKALKAALPQVKTDTSNWLDKRFACTPDGVKGIKCPNPAIGGPFDHVSGPIMKKRAVSGEVNEDKKVAISSVKPNSLRTKEKEQNEFMKRWLQGDEHPRSFMTRSEEPLQKRAMGVEDYHQVHTDYKFDNDFHARRRDDDGEIHHYHGDEDTCSDFSDRYDPRCRNINRYGGLQQKRDLRGKEGSDKEVQMAKRYHDISDYDAYTNCTDLSDRYRPQCQAARAQGLRYTKRSQEVDLSKKKLTGLEGKDVADELQKRWDHSDRNSVQSYRSRNSQSSRGRYRQRAIDSIADQDMVKRSNEDSKDDNLDKRSRYSRHSRYSGRSRNSSWHRRSLQVNGNDAIEKRSHHRGRGQSRNSWHRRDLQGEDDDALEKRSNHSGRGRRQRSRGWHRREITDEADDALEKRSNHSRQSHKSWYRRDLEQGEGNDNGLLEKRSRYSGRSRSSGNGNRYRYRGRSRSSGRGRGRREVKVEIDVLGKRDGLAARNLAQYYNDDDMITVRSALSEHGDIFERGHESFQDILGKREEIPKDITLSKRLVIGREADQVLNKRDLATSIWKMTVAPLLLRREVASSVTIFKRDVI